MSSVTIQCFVRVVALSVAAVVHLRWVKQGASGANLPLIPVHILQRSPHGP